MRANDTGVVPSMDAIKARGMESLIPLRWDLFHMGRPGPHQKRMARKAIREGSFELPTINIAPKGAAENVARYFVQVRDLVRWLNEVHQQAS